MDSPCSRSSWLSRGLQHCFSVLILFFCPDLISLSRGGLGKCLVVFHLPFSSVVHQDLPKCNGTAMTKYSLHLYELPLEVDDPDWKSWTFTIFRIDILHFQKGQGADMEKTDFPVSIITSNIVGITNCTGTGQFKTFTGVPESLESCSVSCAWATPGQTRCKQRASPQRAPWNTMLSSECSPSEHLLVLPREIWVTLHQNKAVV